MVISFAVRHVIVTFSASTWHSEQRRVTNILHPYIWHNNSSLIYELFEILKRVHIRPSRIGSILGTLQSSLGPSTLVLLPRWYCTGPTDVMDGTILYLATAIFNVLQGLLDCSHLYPYREKELKDSWEGVQYNAEDTSIPLRFRGVSSSLSKVLGARWPKAPTTHMIELDEERNTLMKAVEILKRLQPSSTYRKCFYKVSSLHLDHLQPQRFVLSEERYASQNNFDKSKEIPYQFPSNLSLQVQWHP